MYLGSSKNVYSRIMALNHPYRILYNQSTWNEVVYSITLETPYYLEFEKILIWELKPKFNVQHNHAKKTYRNFDLEKPEVV